LVKLRKRFNLSKEELYRLYWSEKLSSKEIAQKTGFSKPCIQHWLRKYEIKVRERQEAIHLRKWKNIPSKEELCRLYCVEKRSMLWIARKFGVYSSTVHRWMTIYGIPGRSHKEANELRDWKPDEEWGRKISESMKQQYKDGRRSRVSSWFTSERVKQMWKKPSFRKAITESVKTRWKDPKFRRKVAVARVKGLLKKPNKIEQKLIQTIRKYNLPLEYSGDGTFIIEGYCPDFISIDKTKKIVELFGITWHTSEDCSKREKAYGRFGFQTLFIWDDELKDEEKVIDKISLFLKVEAE